jgi:hypothetical protein
MRGLQRLYNARRANQFCLTPILASSRQTFPTNSRQAAENRGPNRITLAPITHNATPTQSDPNGRTRSTTISQPIDATM